MYFLRMSIHEGVYMGVYFVGRENKYMIRKKNHLFAKLPEGYRCTILSLPFFPSKLYFSVEE